MKFKNHFDVLFNILKHHEFRPHFGCECLEPFFEGGVIKSVNYPTHIISLLKLEIGESPSVFMRSTGGNSFVGTDPTLGEVMKEMFNGLEALDDWFHGDDEALDMGAITIETSRSNSGNVSVTVMGDRRAL